ncbi:MAG: hypothetical protein ABEH58_03625 [Haloplanus sp.]
MRGALVGAKTDTARIDWVSAAGTTPDAIVPADETAGIRELVDGFDVALTVTGPGFDSVSHPAMDAYVAGEVRGDTGIAGALSLAAPVTVHDRLVGEEVTANA